MSGPSHGRSNRASSEVEEAIFGDVAGLDMGVQRSAAAVDLHQHAGPTPLYLRLNLLSSVYSYTQYAYIAYLGEVSIFNIAGGEHPSRVVDCCLVRAQGIGPTLVPDN